MIATDGRPTAANYRPPHGGYPGATARSDTLPSVTWRDARRVDVTFSLTSELAADAAATLAVAHVEGCTLSPVRGYWQGRREYAYTLSIVGEYPDGATVRGVIAALHGAGCIAVQVEAWNGDGYSVREVRRA